MTLNKFVPDSFTTHWIDHLNKFYYQNPVDSDAKKSYFNQLSQNYRKNFFFKKISLTFLMLSISIAKIEVKWWKIWIHYRPNYIMQSEHWNPGLYQNFQACLGINQVLNVWGFTVH